MDLNYVENIIMTQLKARLPGLTDHKYPEMSFSDEENDKPPGFPNVYMYSLGSRETGNSLQNQQVNAKRYNLQIEISSDVSKDEALEVSNACEEAMKALSFTILSTTPARINNLHRYVIRATRVIAGGDTFD
nr:MAG TPA: hypothetical protein [Caudoviricetes sp.]